MAAEVMDRIIIALVKSRRVSITTDIWSSKLSVNSYIGITCHMVNPSTRKREVYRVCCRVFDVEHTGVNIAKMLKNLFREFKIESKVFRVLSDNASNMKKAVKSYQDVTDEVLSDDEDEDNLVNDTEDESSECDSEPDNIDDDNEEDEVVDFTENMEREAEDHHVAFRAQRLERIGCVAHTMQLPINRCINKKKRCFGAVLRKTRKIVKKYRKSPKAKAILRKKVKTRLAGYVKTRWWTDVAMSKSVVKAAGMAGNPVNEMCYKMEWNLELTDRDITSLKSFIEIMSPFQELSDKLGGEKLSTINLVYPSLIELLSLLDEKIENSEAKTFCQDLKKEFEKYFEHVLDPEASKFDPIFSAATYLDPFHKLSLTDELVSIAKDFIIKIIRDDEEWSEPEVTVTAAETEVESPGKPKFVLPGFSRISQGILTKCKDSPSSVVSGRLQTNIEVKISRDFELYETKAKKVLEKAVSNAEKKYEAKFGDNTDNLEEVKPVKIKAEDPLDFWLRQEKTKEFETGLVTIAQDVMAIPATGVPSERTFNISGILSDNKMSTITPSNLEKRVLIKCNKNLN